MVNFGGNHVVVTGGTGALGTAVVARLRAAGAICHVPNLVAAELENYPHNNDSGVHVTPGVDLSDERAVRRYYQGLPIWASIHLAGGFAMRRIEEAKAADFVTQFNLNALSCFLCCAAAVGAMRARLPSGPPGGRIVNVAARPALEPWLGAGMTAYTASKGAVAALTQALAEELAPDQIWVNAVAPSTLSTPANRAAMPDADHGKWVTTAAVAELIVFLASHEIATRGAVVRVYGGA